MSLEVYFVCNFLEDFEQDRWSLLARYRAVLDAYRAYLEGSPLLYAFETLDVFWWALTTFFIVGVFIAVTRRTHRRYIESTEDSDDF